MIVEQQLQLFEIVALEQLGIGQDSAIGAGLGHRTIRKATAQPVGARRNLDPDRRITRIGFFQVRRTADKALEVLAQQAAPLAINGFQTLDRHFGAVAGLSVAQHMFGRQFRHITFQPFPNDSNECR